VNIQQQADIRFGHLRREQKCWPFKGQGVEAGGAYQSSQGPQQTRIVVDYENSTTFFALNMFLQFAFGDLLSSLRRVEINMTTDGYTCCEIRSYSSEDWSADSKTSLLQRNTRNDTIAAIFNSHQS
jgi:hypothetical protein